MYASFNFQFSTICCLILAFSAQLSTSSQVVINEFTAANYDHLDFDTNIDVSYEDWVELYNSSGSTVDLSGFWLSDKIDIPQRWSFPSGTLIGPGEYMLVVLSGLADVSPYEFGYLNSNFKILQSEGEEIVFSNPDGSVIEYFDFDDIGVNAMNHSHARATDGGDLWQICTSPTPEGSNQGPYGDGYSPMPTMDLGPGFYEGSITVSIASTDQDALIYYTVDGSEPSSGDLLYSGPLNITTTTPLRAIAISPDPSILPSLVATNTYFLNTEPHSVPVLALTAENFENILGTDIVSVAELFDEDGVFVSKAHGQSNEHGADSNAFLQRGFDFVTKDQLGFDHHLTHDFFHNTDRTEYQRLIFQAGGTDHYPSPYFYETMHMRGMLANQLSIKSGLDIDARSDAFCVLYVNGIYHGLYSMREKVDDPDYFKYYYDQQETTVDYIKTWGGTWNEYGTSENWQEVVDFTANNSLEGDAEFDWVAGQVELSSLIDFYILQTYLVNINWMQYDHSWWRGYNSQGGALKWRFSLWDMDDLFWGINYTTMNQTTPTGLPCFFLTQGNPGGQGHVPLVDSLFQNAEFESMYVNRYLNLVNTHFSCENVNLLIDSIENVMIPEMDRHVELWGGSVEEWQAHIQLGRDFMDQRCDDVIAALIDTCWYIEPIPEYYSSIAINGIGTVLVNGVSITQNDSPYEFLFTGANDTLFLEAVNDMGQFISWESLIGETIIDEPENPILNIPMTEDLALTANFGFPDEILDLENHYFDIFPNPAQNSISIRSTLEGRQVDIVDVLGHVVLSTLSSSKDINVDISRLKQGIYTVIFYQPQGQMTKILYVID
jgi:hypothetical protein